MNKLVSKIQTFQRVYKDSGFTGVFFLLALKIIKKPILLIGIRKKAQIKKYWNNRKEFYISPLAFGLSLTEMKFETDFKFSKDIKFSILVPIYNTDSVFLKEMIASVLNQTYSNWELCLADGSNSNEDEIYNICKAACELDSRIKYIKLEKNYGISENTNVCLKMATGDYVSLFDHDDLLHPSALFYTMQAICDEHAELIYTDEAIFENSKLYKILHLHLKKDFIPELLETNNYICHFTSFKKSILGEDMFDSECDGAQDYDIILKVSEKTTCIKHIKRVLYYWRASPLSTASSPSAKGYTTEAGMRALKKHFHRIKENVIIDRGSAPNTYVIEYLDRKKYRKISSADSFEFRWENIF